jgi:hypothetical protein
VIGHHINWRRSYSSDRRTMKDSRLSVFCCCLAVAAAAGAFAVSVLGMFGLLP